MRPRMSRSAQWFENEWPWTARSDWERHRDTVIDSLTKVATRYFNAIASWNDRLFESESFRRRQFQTFDVTRVKKDPIRGKSA